MTAFVTRMFTLHPIVFSSIVLLLIIIVLIGLIIGYCYLMPKLGVEVDDDDFDDDDFDDDDYY